jgi:hypothetical protein
MLLKALLIKMSYGFLAIAIVLIIVKIVLHGRYRSASKEDISLNLAWYRQMDIYGTSSSGKRKFMQQMNFLTTVTFIMVLVFVLISIGRTIISGY